MTTDMETDTLAAVLAYLEGYSDPDEVVGLSSSDDTTAVSSRDSSDDVQRQSSRRVTKKDVAHNRARYRKRLELEALRQEEVNLRERLEKLTHARQVRLEGESSRSNSQRRDMLTVWRDVTKRQFQRRQAVEEENVRLKSRLLEQRHVVKTLKRIIEQQVRKANPPLASARLYSPAWRAVCGDGDPLRMMRVFGELVADLKHIHSTTDDWIQKSTSRPLIDGRFLESRVVPLSPTQLAVEITDLRLLPFPYEVVGDVYWTKAINKRCTVYDFFRETSQVEGRYTIFNGKAFDDDHDTSRLAGVRLRSHLTSQKFVDPDRIVLTNASRTDSVLVEREEVPGVQLTEQYWNVFRPLDSSTRDACLLLSFGYVLITVESGIDKAPRAVPILTRYFEKRMHDHIGINVGIVEDWLLQSSALQ
ncbi:hypothetical protein Poli38472_007581 [Pythium oligandrum]|uniref:Uncharacterized protein n=1 Tax=Pythium oligandrum TaxID=41045 RepID=A0A8K1CRH3_PYTOL|nr:hypothetical protein Poli38472_007581 [Pythium oligandrum]|eukprot:TMW67909.1 hypothetical protein Poli38472_007581 [Pythium oligandrum]